MGLIREELGAGTALSTLHTLGRAVLVLHGHKHYATSGVGTMPASAASPPMASWCATWKRWMALPEGAASSSHSVPRSRRQAQGHRASAFAQVNLMNRYSSRSARLELRGLGERAAAAFASATDLGTGLERPLVLSRGEADSGVAAQLLNCPARTLLRIYWPLEH